MAFFGVWVEFFGANRAIGQKTANRFDAPLSVLGAIALQKQAGHLWPVTVRAPHLLSQTSSSSCATGAQDEGATIRAPC